MSTSKTTTKKVRASSSKSSMWKPEELRALLQVFKEEGVYRGRLGDMEFEFGTLMSQPLPTTIDDEQESLNNIRESLKQAIASEEEDLYWSS